MGRRRYRYGYELLVGLLMAAVLAPALAMADWREFLPHPYENGAFVDSYTSYERDHQDNGGRSSRWEDIYFRQKLTLLSRGYAYHPRFVVYRFSISGAAREEHYDASGDDSTGWRADPGLEYDTSLLFLPEHAYNLEVYARRYEPLLKEQASTQHGSVDSRRGFDFRYRDKPYFAHAGFLDDSIDSGETTSYIDRFNLDGQYFKRFTQGNELSFNGTFIPAWFRNSEDLDGNSIEYSVGNFVNLRNDRKWVPQVRVTSNVTQYFFNQDTPISPHLDTDQLIWSEWLTADLPWNFRHDIYFRHQDSNSKTSGDKQSYTADDLKLDLIHRLYESLDTTYTFLDDHRDSSGGESSLLGHSLVLAYNKAIPSGRVYAGFNVATNENSNHGQIDVIDEPFSTTLPMVQGPYVLGQQNVDPDSIVVYLKSPIDPFERILLAPPYYSVLAVQNTYAILINNVPPPFIGTGPFDFLVSYSYSGDFTLNTNTLGANLSVELFDSLITPYGSYVTSQPDVEEGVFPGGLADSTTYTAGVIVRFMGLQVRGEYQNLDWDISPYESWKVEAQLVRSLTETCHLFSSGSYLNRHYSHGNSIHYQSSFTEETETVSANLQKQLWARSLNLSIGGSYAHVQGLVDSDSYAINSSLIWRIGKVDLTLGVNVYDTSSSGSATSNIERDHQFVYLNLRRRIF